MSVSTVAHLNFTGDARRALEFYHSVFGGQLMIATYAQVGVPQDAPDVFGATGDGGAAPHPAGGARPRAAGLTHTESFFLLLNGETLDELTALREELADGGTVIQALAPASWAPAYGMLTDRFGVTWIFGLAPAE